MRLALAVALLAGLQGSAAPRSACPFAAVASINADGEVLEVQHADGAKPHGAVLAFDSEGQLGRLAMSKDGTFHFTSAVPSRLKGMAMVRVVLVDATIAKAHVAAPGKDLPSGIEPGAVQLLIADGSGPRVALLSLPGETDDSGCDEIDCKVKGRWQPCWTNCQP